MKKFALLSLIIALCSLSCLAQGQKMAVKGCSIEGSTKLFVEKMTQLEFVLDEERIPQNIKGNFSKYALNETPVALKGKLLNRPVTLRVFGSKLSATVYQVNAVFHYGESCYSWKTLLATYDFVTEQFMIKYGKPTSKKTMLTTKSPDDKSIIASFAGVAADGPKSIWEEIFPAEDGIIKVSIICSGLESWCSYGSVVVSYISTSGTALHERELKDAYQSEI